MRNPDTLIIGAGPAGAAAAITLAHGGLQPTVLERSAEPQDALCGGFLSWSTARRLRALGVDPEAIGARPVQHLRLFSAQHDAAVPLPRRCWSISRRSLDAALIRRAQECGAIIERGVKVSLLDAWGGVVLADGTALAPGRTILATGKHELRGAGRVAKAADPAIGLRWRLAESSRLRDLLDGAIELHLFAGGYAGLALQENGSGNLCMAVRKSVLDAAGGDPARLLQRLAGTHAALAERIAAAAITPEPAQAVANMPYGWIAQEPASGAYRIGDQGAVIPSLAGEGIAIALASGAWAGRAVLEGIAADRFQRKMHRRVALPIRAAGIVGMMATGRGTAAPLVGAVKLMPGLARLAARLSRIGRD